MNVDGPAVEHKGEYVVPVLATLSLLISCVLISAKKYFWNDELLSYYLLSDRSFRHMLAAFHDELNSAPPLYFLVGWLWAKVFGASELSLRLISWLGISAGLWAMWVTLRRTFGFWATAIGVLGVFCALRIIVDQSVEARMYGLFVGFCAVGLFFYDTACQNARHSWGLLVGTFCTHAALVNTHLFGGFYSGALLASLILRDTCVRIFRPRLYLTIVLSWLSLLPYIPSFFNQSRAITSRAWLPKPILNDLIEFVSLCSLSQLSLYALAFVVLISGLQVVACGVTARFETNRIESDQSTVNPAFSVLIPAYAFLAVPVFVWIFSRVWRPMFFDRYMLPTALAWSILLAYSAAQLLGYATSVGENRRGDGLVASVTTSFLPLLLVLFLLAQPLIYARTYARESRPGSKDEQVGHIELPIVVQHSHDFLKRIQYAAARERYFFILDWQAAVDEDSGLFGPQEYRELDAIRRNYPEVGKQIIDGGEFLLRHRRFLVIDSPDFDRRCPRKVSGVHTRWEDIDCPQWLDERLLNNRAYKVESLGGIDGEIVLLVEQR